MDAGAGVEHRMPGGQFDRAWPEGVLDQQFAALVGVGLAEEYRAGDIGAYAFTVIGAEPNRVVDMFAIAGVSPP